MVIDAQVHAYEVGSPTGPTVPHPSIAEVSGDQMVSAMDRVGVDGAICVSPWSIYGSDTTYTESVYCAHPTRFRLVAPLDPYAPGVRARLEGWAGVPGAVGVRILDLSHAGYGTSLNADDPAVTGLVKQSTDAGLTVNVMCWGRLSLIAGLAGAFPDAQFVLDHLGLTQPPAPPAPDDVFGELPLVLALAQYPNIAVKVSGACTYSHLPFPYEDLWGVHSRGFGLMVSLTASAWAFS